MEMSVKEYLDSVANLNTRKGYRIGIQKFSEWFGKTPSEFLDIRKDDLTARKGEDLIEYKFRAARFEKEIEKFHGSLLEKGYATNTARSLTVGILQLFRYYEMPVKIRRGSAVSKTVKTSRSFPLRIEHVRKMFEVADLRERAILNMATDLGLRISDFIKITKKDLPSLDQETPIEFDMMTGKEEVVAHGFLSDETVKLLKVYLPTLKKNNIYLFPSNGQSHMSDEWLNRLLQRLAAKAQISMNNKSLTFHCFRKMFLSTSIDSAIGLTAGKKLCGKAIPISDDTYLTTLKLREKFIQLKRFLSISEEPKVKTQEIEEFKKILTNLQGELTCQKKITEVVSEENLKIKKELQFLNDIVNPLQPMLEFVNSFESADAMLEFLKAIKEKSATARQRAKEEQDFQKAEKKVDLKNDTILQAAIQATEETIEKKNGKGVTKKRRSR